MLIYKNKIFVKPVEYKLVEVEVEKQGEGYDVKTIGKPIEITTEELRETRDISIEEAFKFQHKQEEGFKLQRKSKKLLED